LPGQLLNWSCCLDHPGSGAWNSWACPGLITLNSTLASQMFLYHNYLSYVQVCRRPGDPNKLMFCKRCDGAYHCYCQQPSHKVHLHPPFSIVLIYGSYLSTAQHVMFQKVTMDHTYVQNIQGVTVVDLVYLGVAIAQGTDSNNWS
jgi:hypothetical protein